MTDEQIIRLPKLFDLQSAFRADTERFKVLCAGRRWGKTELITVIISLATIEGKNVAYYSMNYKQMTETFNKTLKRMKPMLVRQNLANFSYETISGGRLTCWSGEASTTTRGAGYDLFIIDEASFIPNLWDKFTGDILPTLADKMGSAIICSTPKGFNDFYRLYMRGMDGEPNWKSYRYPTSTSPMVSPESLASLKAIMSDLKFREEFEAEFVSSEGMVFRNITDALVAPPESAYNGRFVMGVDWGKSNDYTALSVWDVDKKCEVELDRFNKQDWSLQRGKLKALADKWSVTTILAESNSIGQPQIEELAKEGLPVEPFAMTAQSKPKLIEGFALALEKYEVKLIDDMNGTQELSSYAMTPTSNGTWKYSAPNGGHDDTVIARALGYRACNESSSVIAYQHNIFMKRN